MKRTILKRGVAILLLGVLAVSLIGGAVMAKAEEPTAITFEIIATKSDGYDVVEPRREVKPITDRKSNDVIVKNNTVSDIKPNNIANKAGTKAGNSEIYTELLAQLRAEFDYMFSLKTQLELKQQYYSDMWSEYYALNRVYEQRLKDIVEASFGK